MVILIGIVGMLAIFGSVANLSHNSIESLQGNDITDSSKVSFEDKRLLKPPE